MATVVLSMGCDRVLSHNANDAFATEMNGKYGGLGQVTPVSTAVPHWRHGLLGGPIKINMPNCNK